MNPLEELDVTNKLLEERNRLLNAIPECPEHGAQCVPHGIEYLAKLEAVVECAEELNEVAGLRGDNQLPRPEDDPGLWTARMQTAWDELEEALEE